MMSVKRFSIGALAAVMLVCLGMAAALGPVNSKAEGEYLYYVNVGSENFTSSDADYGLGAGTAQTEGKSDKAYVSGGYGYTKGEAGISAESSDAGTLFESYRNNAEYKFDLTEGSYRVALAVNGEASATVNGTAVNAEGTGKRVIAATFNGALTVSVTGNLYGILITPSQSKVLMFATWEEGQVIVYGNLLEDELHPAIGHYSDGSTEEKKIEYDSVAASGGINVNFNSVTVTGTIEGTSVKVNRFLIIMPEKLVYFINAGSATGIAESDWAFADSDENDNLYQYNQVVWDFYGSELKNYGTPDQESKSDSEWGYYTKGYHAVRRSATYAYPFNTARVTSGSTHGTSDVKYRLTGLDAGQEYILYIGTMSYWHQRTVGLTLNGTSIKGGIVIRPSRDVNEYTVTGDSSGVLDIQMTGANTDEANVIFIALQKAEDGHAQIPAAVSSDVNTVGLEDTSILLTGAEQGAKLQLYGSARPYALLYEEMVSEDNFEGGKYRLDYGRPLTGTFYIVQITSGGASEGFLVSVTDIEDFAVTRSVTGYTAGSIILNITAHATSGLEYYTVRKDREEIKTFNLGGVYAMDEHYIVTENGSYEIVVYSGLGVSYAYTESVAEIDPARPTIGITPAGDFGEKFNLKVSVNTLAPVNSFAVYKNGEQISSSASVPETLALDSGEYIITASNAAGFTVSVSVTVGSEPRYSEIAKKVVGKDLEITLTAKTGEMSSLSAYSLSGGSASKLNVIGGNMLRVYDDGTYVAVVTMADGSVEVFSIPVSQKDFKSKGCRSSVVAPAMGIMLFALAAALRRKK